MPRPRKPEDLRRAVLDASAAVIATSGIDALSLRDVARRAGVTHGAPYHYFADKQALLDALAQEGFAGLRDAMRTAMAGIESPEEKLAAIGRVYVGYAVEHPGHFRVMFRPRAAGRPAAEPVADADAFQVLVDTIAEAQRAGAAPAEETGTLVLLAWSAVHGLASLWLEGAVGEVPISRAGVSETAARLTSLLARLYAVSARRRRSTD